MMKRKLLLPLGLVAGFVAAATIVRGRQAPQYAWLHFGPKVEARVLVRLDGPAVTLTHYRGDGPTGRTEHFDYWSGEEVVDDPEGPTRYHIMRISGSGSGGDADRPPSLSVSVTVERPAAYRQYCDTPLTAGTPRGAAVAHFGGPLTVQAVTANWELPPGLALRRGETPTDLRALVGTLDAETRCWTVVYVEHVVEQRMRPSFPDGVHPYVDVEFPPARPNDPPPRRRYPLDQAC